MRKPKREKLPKVLQDVGDGVHNLLEMFEFYLMERRLSKPIEVLSDSVRDLRIIIQQILLEHFLSLSPYQGERFIGTLATALAKRSTRVPAGGRGERKYANYVIGEILVSFEWAAEIKKEFPDDELRQRILALDIPVLRPFDYGLRSMIRLVKPPKKKRK